MSINRVIISGNAGRDPEVKYTTEGKAIASFSVAVQGYKQGDTSWVSVTLFDKAAEFAANYIRKGSLVLVDGRLKEETWDDRETGKKRSKIVLIGDRIEAPKAAQPGQGNTPEDYDDVVF